MTKTEHARKPRTLPQQRKFVFTDLEYGNNNGMVTTVWGPAMWHFLHTMSFNYPVEPTLKQKRQYYDFVKSLQHVLPCGKCRSNLKKNFRKLPLTMKEMESRSTFSKYIYDLHELVNKMLKKRSGISYDEVRDMYEHFRARCHTSKKQVEDGCVEPIYEGETPQAVIQVVPQTCSMGSKRKRHIVVSDRCLKTRKLS